MGYLIFENNIKNSEVSLYTEICAFTWPILMSNFVITHFAVLEKQRGW